MKKFICLILTLMLTMQISFAAESVQDGVSYDTEQLSKAVYILNDLGITALQEETEIWQNKSVTRAEFAEMVCKAFKIETTSDNIYFVDVPYDMWAFKAVTSMAESGFISVPEDRRFRPDDTVTYAEALKMILSAANYDIYAEYNGGFPYGYTKAANRMELGVTAGADTGLTVPGAVTLIYDVLSMGFYEPQAYSDTDAVPYKESEEIILAAIWDTYIERGEVQAYYGAGYNAEVYEPDEAVIDGVEYKLAIAINLNDYFLSEVEFIYKKSSPDDVGSIVYMESTGDEKEELISSEDVSGFESGTYTLTYFKGDKSMNKNLDRGSAVVYNGAAYGGSMEEIIEEFTSGNKKGTIRVKEVDGKDVVIIKAYRNFVVGYANSATSRLYNIFGSDDCLDISEYRQATVKSLEGADTTLDYSIIPMLLAVAESKDKSTLEIVVCRDKVTGKIEEVSNSGSETYLTIGGTKYELDHTMYMNQMLDENGDVISNSALLGTEYDFYIDNFGKLAYMSTLGAGNGFSIGYIVDGVVLDDAFSSYIGLKMLTENEGVVEYTAKDKLIVDGVSYKLDNISTVIEAIRRGEAVNSVTAEEGHLAQQIVRYKSDENKVITELDTAYLETEENEDNTLTLVIGDGKTSYSYKATTGMPKFGNKILLSNTNTKFFAKPLVNDAGNLIVMSTTNDKLSGNIIITKNDKTKTEVLDKSGSPFKPDDSMYKTGIVRGFVSDGDYVVYAYKFNPSTPYCDAVVYSYQEYAVPEDFLMVEEIAETLGADGDVSKMLVGWVRGAKITYEIADNSDTADLECGDIVYLWKDVSGKRSAFVKKIYDCSDDEFVNRPYVGDSFAPYLWNVEVNGEYWWRYALSKGLVHHKNGTMMAWDWDGNYRTYEEAFDFSSIPITIYDKEARNNKVYAGSVAEIPDYKSVGENNAARILMNTWQLVGRGAFVYLNN